MEEGRIFQIPSSPLSLIKTYQMSLILARSISLDSTSVPLSYRHWFAKVGIKAMKSSLFFKAMIFA
jgi:hypothetical protein